MPVRPHVIVTAGFTRSLPAVALLELLRRDQVIVAGVLVTSAFNLTRVKTLVRQRGLGFVKVAIKRLYGADPAGRVRQDNVKQFLQHHGIRAESLTCWSRRNKVP